MTLDDLLPALDDHGLRVLGVVQAESGDVAPQVEDAGALRTLILVGNAGSSLWPVFSASTEYGDGQPDSLDRWSRRIGDQLATTFDLRVFYPFGGPPHYPFQRWATRAAQVHPSPLRLQIHPEFGLWHAYRFALASTALLPGGPIKRVGESESVSPCLACVGQPCLQACPARAFDGGYDAQTCLAYLETHPEGACVTQGCAARHACPVGGVHRYAAGHAQFHMRAFVAAGARRG